ADNRKQVTLTLQGAILGTPFYMSPEQAKGTALDARTDIFSLGVVIYEMATGEKPFVGKTRDEIRNAILNRQPASPLARNPSLPFRFEPILFKALEKSCEFRYQSAYELHADLQRLKREVDSATLVTRNTVSPMPPDRHGELPVARQLQPVDRSVGMRLYLERFLLTIFAGLATAVLMAMLTAKISVSAGVFTILSIAALAFLA